MPHQHDHPEWDHEQQVAYDRGYADQTVGRGNPSPRTICSLADLAEDLSGVKSNAPLTGDDEMDSLYPGALVAVMNAYWSGWSEARRDKEEGERERDTASADGPAGGGGGEETGA